MKKMTKQNGNGSTLTIVTLLLSGVLVYQLVFIPAYNKQVTNDLRSMPPATTVEDSDLVDSYKLKPQSNTIPKGEYTSKFSRDGKDITVVYYFTADGRVSKTLSLDVKELLSNNVYLYSGDALYEIEGSVLTFSDVKGDLVLFPEIGEAVTISIAKLVIHESGAEPITLIRNERS